jgi:hypothetical protein
LPGDGIGIRFLINLKGQLMKKVILLRVGLLMCAISLFACGCVVSSPDGGVVVTDYPPAPLVETVPADPGAVWVPHQYVNRDGKHVFVRGGWR